MADLSALYRDDATEDNYVEAMQEMVDSGQAWLFEGSVGRSAMDLLRAGKIILGKQSHKDYYGNVVPSRYDVKPGSLGSVEYAEKMREED